MDTLRDHVNRISHLVINVSDLERSRSFYESNTPLRVYRKLEAPTQALAVLGIVEGSFDALVMADASGTRPGVSVHLVQWNTPKPSGSPYPCFFHRGFYRFCFLTSDLEARYRRSVELGHPPFLPPQGHGIPVPGGSEGLSIVIPDPDGIPAQMTLRPDRWRDDLPDQLYHVNIVSSDVDRSRNFLNTIVGLEYVKRLTLPEPVTPIGFGLGSDHGQFDAAFLWHRGDQRFSIDIVDWFLPGVVGQPYADPTNLGIQRLGFEVDDLESATDALRRQLPPALRSSVHGPERWNIGEAGSRWVTVFRDWDGITFELVQQDPFDGARESPWTAADFSLAPLIDEQTPIR